MFRNRGEHFPQNPFPRNRENAYDEMAVAHITKFTLRTIGMLNFAAVENGDLRRELEESKIVNQEQSERYLEETIRNRILTATVRMQEAEIIDLKAQLVRLATDRRATDLADLDAQLARLDNVLVRPEQLKAEYEKLDTLSAAIVASPDLVIFVPPAEQQHECAACLEEVYNLRVKCNCNCVNRVCPQCFHQSSSQVCPICRAGPV